MGNLGGKGPASDAPPVTRAAGSFAQSGKHRSEIIAALQARRSVLPQGSAQDRVASAVLAAYARPAEAELRGARLRAQAASKNWLPTLGPSVSLTSLGAVVAGLVVEQVLFDNGRKKAERELARADVEHAAVVLSSDTNARVYEALSLYLGAEEARAKAALSAKTLSRVGEFDRIITAHGIAVSQQAHIPDAGFDRRQLSFKA